MSQLEKMQVRYQKYLAMSLTIFIAFVALAVITLLSQDSLTDIADSRAVQGIMITGVMYLGSLYFVIRQSEKIKTLRNS